MKTYDVELSKTVYRVFTVTAETQKEAIELAFDKLTEEENPFFWDFSHIEETKPETVTEPQT